MLLFSTGYEGKKKKKFTKTELQKLESFHGQWELHRDKKSAKHPPVQTLPTTETDSCSERKTLYEQRQTHSQPPTCIVKSRKSVIFKNFCKQLKHKCYLFFWYVEILHNFAKSCVNFDPGYLTTLLLCFSPLFNTKEWGKLLWLR